MRPHVELIQENDYIWHAAELVGGEGRASERRLSVDEEDGSCSLRLAFHTRFGRPAGICHADTEFYVLDGAMTYGGKTAGKGAYLHIPKGVPADWVAFAEGSRVLHYREYGDAGFDAAPVDGPRREGARGEVIFLDSDAMTWDAVPNPGPMPGMFIKYLHVDPVTGFYTRLVHAQEGWTDHRLAHHPCYEEAYTVQGHMEYNFGTLDLGTYFFRPARVKHGHFTTQEGGATWLLRSDGELLNWYTQNEWVRWGGESVNWGPAGERVRFSQSAHDLAEPNRRSARDTEELAASVEYQRGLGEPDDDFVPHGVGTDPSLTAILKARDAARLQGGHGHDHDHDHGDHDHDWGADPASLEHPEDRDSHVWGEGRTWKPGTPVPAPILSSRPVRSAATGRWDGEGM